jgi:hypothetical protein
VIAEARNLSDGITLKAYPGPVHAVDTLVGTDRIEYVHVAVLPAGFDMGTAIL